MKLRSSYQRKRNVRGTYLSSANYSRQSSRFWLMIFARILGILAVGWSVLFISGSVTLGGVPASIVGKFLKDPIALRDFFLPDKARLHQRLQALGIEEEIKAYYRPKIANEVELDRYIHQILYNWTGYVGKNYWLTSKGVLILKKSGELRLRQELQPSNSFIFVE